MTLPIALSGCRYVERQHRDDLRVFVAPNHGKAAKPVVYIQSACAIATYTKQAAVPANRPVDVGVLQDGTNEVMPHTARLTTTFSVIRQHRFSASLWFPGTDYEASRHFKKPIFSFLAIVFRLFIPRNFGIIIGIQTLKKADTYWRPIMPPAKEWVSPSLFEYRQSPPTL
ncbi:hypothetical protein LB554_24915 [Mesorhizobium sp. CO1-1-11]|uniref:hypothetical protein n=1 Tax=Mesorhizobium sp. CO1-1-11 TaxID=2876636 RepID=UPI001CC97AB0|nr:hypothetical protein [Mesorhizobium sp. CO1-1-11]MBZ9727190.1 hypothetical protein [Mesorhizobium sp. CO1-1-11]